jgi:hypothetical protein
VREQRLLVDVDRDEPPALRRVRVVELEDRRSTPAGNGVIDIRDDRPVQLDPAVPNARARRSLTTARTVRGQLSRQRAVHERAAVIARHPGQRPAATTGAS